MKLENKKIKDKNNPGFNMAMIRLLYKNQIYRKHKLRNGSLKKMKESKI